MALIGAFVSSTLAMMGQAHALKTIGNNVANVNTGGYKRNDTHFAGVLSKTLFEQSNLGGIKVKEYQRISEQGRLAPSNSDTDVAISGDGYFIVKAAGSTGGKTETRYTRDGSFQITTGSLVPATADDGSTIQIKEGFLSDKNGNRVQGFAPDPLTGVFPATGTLSDLRVDQFAFTQSFQATTTANLDLNLPAGDVNGVKQIDLVSLGGTVETGDIFNVTVNSVTVSLTVGGQTSLDAVRDALVTALNANATIGAAVTAAANPISGALNLTGKVAGDTFTASASTTNVAAGITDNSVTSNNVQAASTAGTETFAIDVFNSKGKQQTATLNFTKTATNTWDLSATTSQDAVAQVDTMTIAGTVEAGDIFTVVIDGTNASYTVTGAEANIGVVRDNLVTAINSNTTINSKVTAAAGAAGQITLTAKTAGTAFTSGASTTQGIASVAQVGSVTIAGAVDAGDVVRATINGTDVDYIVSGGDTTVANIAAGLIAAINANATVNTSVTASGGAGGVVTITSDTAGVPFTLLASDPTDPGLDTSATPAAVTANVTALTDNTASVVNTTANKAPTVTTAKTGLVFDGAGQITTPTTKSVTLPLTFAGGGTATVALDISGLTQFDGALLPINYQKNGFGSSLMSSFNVDSDGQIIGNFQNNTTRVLYKIPLATFTNPDGLDRRNGNTFALSRNSGAVTVNVAGSGGAGTMIGNTVELSNVRLTDEFTKLIITQNAYNSAATVFRTVDEMTTVARDLKN